MIFDVDVQHVQPDRRPIHTGLVGRPRNCFDKKAYDRKKAAERRAKLKAEGK